MLLRKMLILLILPVNIQALKAENNVQDLLSVISDFIDKQEGPTLINLCACWSKRDIVHLSERLWKNNHRLRILSNSHKPIFSSHKKEHEVVVIDMKCKNVDQIFDKRKTKNDLVFNSEDVNFLRHEKTSETLMDEAKTVFNQPSRWIVLGNVTDIISRNLNIGLDSKFFVIEEVEQVFRIIAVFKYSKDFSEFESNEIAIWSRQRGIESFTQLTIGRNRTNLKGLQLKISYVITNLDSLKHLWDYRQKHIDTVSKLNYLLVHYLLDFINATQKSKNHSSWGYKIKNSTLYDGMLGDLQKGIVDLGGTPLFFVHDRIDLVDYIASTYKTYMKFIFRAPPLSYIANIFYLPFDGYVWVSCLAIILLSLITIYIVLLWEYNASFKNECQQNPQNTLRPTISEVTLFEISAIFQQGYPTEPRSLAGRITMMFMFGAVLFLYTSYSASIVVLLQSTSNSINSLEDLLNTRIELGVEDIIYSYHYFGTAQDETRKAIYDRKIAPNKDRSNFISINEGVKRVQNEFFGFHAELSNGYKVIGDLFKESEKCGLREIAYVNVKEPWLSVKKNSMYKEIMKVGLRRIHEHGLQHREASRLYTKKPNCNANNGNFVNVGLRECYFVFIIFVVGVVFSVMLLFVEYMKHRYMEKKEFEVINGFD